MAGINKNGLLAGKVAVITGASRGIGEAIALRYAMEGAKVVVSARTMDEGDHVLPGSINGVVNTIVAAGGEAAAVRCDLALPEHRENLINETVEKFGPIDILVNNASAIFLAGTQETPMKRYDLMHHVNTRGTFLTSQKCLPYLKKSDNPHRIQGRSQAGKRAGRCVGSSGGVNVLLEHDSKNVRDSACLS